METLFPFLIMTGFVAVVAFSFGRLTVKYPPEDEMIQRLVNARVERKLRALTKDDIDQEIDQASDRIVARSRA